MGAASASMGRAGGRELDGAALDQDALGGLRRMNLIVGLIHLAQAGIVLAISNDFALPVARSFLVGPPGTTPERAQWFTVRLGPAIALFLLLAAIDHLLLAAPGVNRWYNGMLARERNDARWIEYSVSASLMIVLIAMVSGVDDLSALIAIAAVNACMIFFGLLMERVSTPSHGGVNWMPFIYGCFAGAVPWALIVLQLATAENLATDAEGVPTFVYGIVVSLFLLFNCFAVNMILQYRRVGKWRDGLYAERAYIVLSLVAKSALAWQVFGNVLAG